MKQPSPGFLLLILPRFLRQILRYFLFTILICQLSGISNSAYGQVAGDYRTRAANNWNSNLTWQVYSGGIWVNCVAGDYPGAAAGTGSVTLTNNVSFTASPPNSIGALNISANLTPANSNLALIVTGNVAITAGILNLSANNNRVFTLTIGGDFTMSGGTITETANSYGSIIFNKSGTQIYSKTGGTISNTINFTVNNGSILNVGTSLIDGSNGTFTLNPGAGIITAHSQGLSLAAATGSIQVTGTRTFSSSASYTYNGIVAQVTGNGLTAANGLTINNTTGVSLTNSISITGTLTLTAGAFSIGANTLGIANSANLAYGGGSLTGGTTSSLTIGTGTGITLNSISGGLNNFNISRNITLGGNLSLNGTLTLTAGTFTVGVNTLTMNGPAIAGTPSNLTTSAASNLVFGGTSAGVSIPSSVTNLNDLTVNNANGVTLAGSISVGNTLTMTQGNIISGANTLTISNSAAGSLSYTAGTITGKIQRAVGSTGVEYLYPVGTATGNNPLKITFTTLTAGQLAIRFQPNDIGVTGLPLLGDSGADIYDRQTTGYWTLTAIGSMASTNYSVKLNYSGFSGVDALARILARTDGGSLFLNGTHGTVSSPEISRTGMNGISTISTDLAIGKPNLRITSQPVKQYRM